MKGKGKCECGARLPHHLAELAGSDTRFRHVCSCERAYKVVEGVLVLDGTEANPIARHDAAMKKARGVS